MTDIDSRRTYAPAVEAQLRELGVLASRIEQTDRHLKGLYDQRRDLFRGLLDAGVPQAQIARKAKVTGMSVALAVGKAAGATKAASAKPKRK